MTKYDILVDSDAFVGRMYTKDVHHKRVTDFFTKIEESNISFITTSQVIEEVATVLSHKVNHKVAVYFLSIVSSFPKIHITPELHQAGLEIFAQQKRKGTSAVDCTNVAVMRAKGINRIFSFDKVYAKDFGIELVGK